MPNTDLPKHLRKPLLDLLAAGGCVARDGSRMLIDGPPPFADALRGHAEQLAQHVVPSVSAEEAEHVRSLLADAGASVAYITSPSEARRAVAEICASDPDVIGLDFETEVLPAFRQPIPSSLIRTATSPPDNLVMVRLVRRSTHIVPRCGSSKLGQVASTVTSSICGL
jgi:hypothetical protein